jgi:hypothetical protein
MDKDAKRRLELRTHGVTNAPCHACYFFPECGGIESSRPLFSCFDERCCGDGSCNSVCPNHPDFEVWYREVNGLRFGDLPELVQTPIVLPRYVPVVDHGSSRHRTLEVPFAALNTYRVVGAKHNEYRTVANTPEGLREHFALSPSVNIILRGVAKDPPLERYWHYRKSDDAPNQLARLGISLAIAPNFSHPLNVPRTDNLFNRKRHLICLQELAAAGLCAVPHLSAVVPGDWRFWREYLAMNPSIRYVAKEFETGNKNPNEGRKTVRELAAIQRAIGRPLHPLLIAGAQFAEDLAANFEHFTIIDSTPFIKAVFRQGFDSSIPGDHWYPSLALVGQGIDRLLERNIAGYSDWLYGRITARVAPGVRGLIDSVPPAMDPGLPEHGQPESPPNSPNFPGASWGIHGGELCS